MLTADHNAVRRTPRAHHRRHRLGRAEVIVSPDSKACTYSKITFVEKTARSIAKQVHLLVMDLLPPSHRDAQEGHEAIWDRLIEGELEIPAVGADRRVLRGSAGPGGLNRAGGLQGRAAGRAGPARAGGYVPAPLRSPPDRQYLLPRSAQESTRDVPRARDRRARTAVTAVGEAVTAIRAGQVGPSRLRSAQLTMNMRPCSTGSVPTVMNNVYIPRASPLVSRL